MDDILIIQNRLLDLRRYLKSKLHHAPEGRLQISRCGKPGSVRFYRIGTGQDPSRRIGIGRDNRLVERLAHKAFLSEKLARTEKDLAVINDVLSLWSSLDDEDIIKALPRNFNLFPPEILLGVGSSALGRIIPCPKTAGIEPVAIQTHIDGTPREEWARMPYAENTKCPEFKTHISSVGLKCRSKSELSIFESYLRLQPFFHYDEVVNIDGYFVSPDFIGMRDDGSIVIHEHEGLDTLEYRNHNKWKYALYEKSGFVLGRNFFISYEDKSGNINMELVEALIRNYYG